MAEGDLTNRDALLASLLGRCMALEAALGIVLAALPQARETIRAAADIELGMTGTTNSDERQSLIEFRATITRLCSQGGRSDGG